MARSKTKKISHFNSRPSARGDVRAASRGRGLCISIHAPPRGATQFELTLLAWCAFQFTPLREGRPNASSSATNTL